MEKTVESAAPEERESGSVQVDVRGFSAALARRAKPYVVPLVLSSILAYFAIDGILERAGRPALPLDDSFIHLQYARRFAEGHPFSFANHGTGFSSGATSFLWPLMLAPFYLCGLHGLSLVYASWLLGTLFHAALVLETKRLAEPLVGRAAAFGVAGMCLFFGAFAWFAWSGMETIPFTWALVRGVRVTADYLEKRPAKRTMGDVGGVVAMGIIAPLFRPEGGVVSLIAAGALVYAGTPAFAERRFGRVLSRVPSLIPLGAVAFLPILNFALTGHVRSTTAMVKWYVGNPYLDASGLYWRISGTMKMFVTDLLTGGYYTAEFLPDFTLYLVAAGCLALVAAMARKPTRPRAILVTAFLLSSFIPCTFETILWNRVRYIWPWAPAWFIAIGCLGRQVGDLVQRWMKGVDFVAPLIAGSFAGAVATRLKGSLDDLAQSARAINLQQVTLGMWAKDHLPEDARIGVNDTGAIAYMSDRRTFDVVGLTTEGEAKYWVEGAGSRYEHYERMREQDLPTHFIVYPEWFGMKVLFGRELTHATVTDGSILGGATKVAYVASYDVLGRGSLPTHVSADGKLLDEVDVADMESESEHHYWVGPTNKEEDQVFTSWDDEGRDVADGGRVNRYFDGFVVNLPANQPVRMVVRLAAEHDTTLTVTASDKQVAEIELPTSGWEEREIELPADVARGSTPIRIAAKDDTLRFTSMHYWFFSREP